MNGINNIYQWKNALGLLPINQFSGSQHNGKFILLNGGSGDFCIDLGESSDSREFYFSSAWSSNTKNFVRVNGTDVVVYNWEKNEVKTHSVTKVTDNLSKFYKYLVSNSYRSEYDIVPFVISVFRKLRNLYNNRTNPTDALDQLFLLLRSLESESTNNLEWGIDISVSAHSNLEKYVDEFKKGVSGIEPQLDLIMRHSLGMVFQEAQKEVLFFDKQTSLFSPETLSDTYFSKTIPYSSVHHTPSFLARCIVENSLKEIELQQKDSLKIFDPSCGSSEFLLEVLKQLKALNYQGRVIIHGWDCSEIAIKTSRFLLKYEQRNWDGKLDISLKLVSDSLAESWDTNFDLILMNPPFVSWEKLGSKEAREVVRESLSTVFDGKPNQASAFFYKAICSLKSDGVIGSVIPSSILTLDAYKKLRNEVNSSTTLHLIGKLGNYIFEDALVDVSLIVAKNSKILWTPTVIWTSDLTN